ncbi:hypothetical protein CBM2606_A100064 [Cupriavidus taiwanensis]|nr:hypothetical protein CBM2606_A100064 [Cupriavidus taiwanensis]
MASRIPLHLCEDDRGRRKKVRIGSAILDQFTAVRIRSVDGRREKRIRIVRCTIAHDRAMQVPVDPERIPFGVGMIGRQHQGWRDSGSAVDDPGVHRRVIGHVAANVFGRLVAGRIRSTFDPLQHGSLCPCNMSERLSPVGCVRYENRCVALQKRLLPVKEWSVQYLAAQTEEDKICRSRRSEHDQWPAIGDEAIDDSPHRERRLDRVEKHAATIFGQLPLAKDAVLVRDNVQTRFSVGYLPECCLHGPVSVRVKMGGVAADHPRGVRGSRRKRAEYPCTERVQYRLGGHYLHAEWGAVVFDDHFGKMVLDGTCDGVAKGGLRWVIQDAGAQPIFLKCRMVVLCIRKIRAENIVHKSRKRQHA